MMPDLVTQREAVPRMGEQLFLVSRLWLCNVKVIVLFSLQAKEIVRESAIITLSLINYTNTTVINIEPLPHV